MQLVVQAETAVRETQAEAEQHRAAEVQLVTEEGAEVPDKLAVQL